MIAVKLNSFGKLPILGRGKVYPFIRVYLSIFNAKENYPSSHRYLDNLFPNRKD